MNTGNEPFVFKTKDKSVPSTRRFNTRTEANMWASAHGIKVFTVTRDEKEVAEDVVVDQSNDESHVHRCNGCTAVRVHCMALC